MVQLSHPYVITGKTITLTIWTFVGKVMSLVINVLSSCYSFSSKEQTSFTFMAAVSIVGDFGAQENKICHYSTFPPSICQEVMRLNALILVSFFTLLFDYHQEAL